MPTKNTNRLFAIAVLVCSLTDADAETDPAWQQVTSSERSTTFFDAANLKASQAVRYVNVLVNIKKRSSLNFKSFTSHGEINCKANKAKTLDFKIFEDVDAQGEIHTSQTPSEEIRWEAITPKSVFAPVKKIVCAPSFHPARQ